LFLSQLKGMGLLPKYPEDDDSSSSVDPFDTELRVDHGAGAHNATGADGEADCDAEWAQV
jgi:hypothetical protein